MGARHVEEGVRVTPLGFIAILITIGVLLGGLGGSAYAGLWRSWRGRLHQNVVFGWFWLGLAILSMGLAATFVRTPVFGFSFVFVVTAAVAGVLAFWVLVSGAPRWLQPHWYRVERER